MTELTTESSPLGTAPVEGDLEAQLEQHRRELTGYAYRMLGSTFEAEDAVQETLIRAWRSYDTFEGRAAFKSWLYRITTNVCLDMLKGSQRRARPMDLGPAQIADASLLGDPLPEVTWLEPMPDDRIVDGSDPAEVVAQKESIRLAFVAALQHLPSNQRAVLILREVLRWKATEVAELLETSVQSVNSALQRARATLEAPDVSIDLALHPTDEDQSALLARYVEAFESYDMDALTSLLREDATWSMPPYALWLNTHDEIVKWCLGPGIGCKDSRLVATTANGSPAFAHYKPSPDGGREAWSLQVLDIQDGEIAGICFFLDTARFYPLFGLPLRLDN
jgi:RNA polymerase sigma-70 factor, ECF subfamily